MSSLLHITNETRGTVLATAAHVADNAISRVVGLLRHDHLDAGDGLLITPCNSIHSFFMRFRFDAIFLTRDGEVVHQIENMAPWGISKIAFRAHSVLELPAGVIAQTGTQIGDKLKLEKCGVD